MRKETRICDTMPDEELLIDLAELFKIFGDSTRVRLLFALLEGEMNVNDLAGALSMTASAVSHQLKILRQAKLVSTRRDGKRVYYALADEHVQLIIHTGLEHIME